MRIEYENGDVAKFTEIVLLILLRMHKLLCLYTFHSNRCQAYSYL